MESKPLVRLSKIMAERGICSRREADELIEKGHVYVDGLRVKELGIKVDPDCRIELSEAAKTHLASAVTVILNKPIGYVSAQPEPEYEPAIVLLTAENYAGETPLKVEPKNLNGLAVAGRLDIDSQGLLVFTQDGTIAKTLIGENSPVEKEYLVRVAGDLSSEGLQRLRHGLMLDGVVLKRAHVEWINEDQLRFVLTEGRKRQVRRMCEAVGLRVLGLKRVRVGAVRLGKLPEGKWRYLEPGESFLTRSFEPNAHGRALMEQKASARRSPPRFGAGTEPRRYESAGSRRMSGQDRDDQTFGRRSEQPAPIVRSEPRELREPRERKPDAGRDSDFKPRVRKSLRKDPS